MLASHLGGKLAILRRPLFSAVAPGNAAILPRLRDDRVLPNLFQFISCPGSPELQSRGADPASYTRLCACIYRGALVSAPLQAFVCFFLLLNVLLQLANKNGIQKQKNKKRNFTRNLSSSGTRAEPSVVCEGHAPPVA
jgi:hypothetical protein